MAIVVITALEREAALLRRRGHRVVVGGVGPQNAEVAARAVMAEYPELVISAGFAGALTDDLVVGDVVRPDRVLDATGRDWPCYCGDGRTLLSVDRLVGEPDHKRDLARETGASAVDMESAAIARVCATAGIAFLCVRAISDAAPTRLSPELVKLLDGGRASPLALIRQSIRTPRLLGELWRLAHDTRTAAVRLAAALHPESLAKFSSAARKPL